MSNHVRSDRSKSKSPASATPCQLTPFGQPQLLEGEDPAAYDQLLAGICAAVKPVDIIEEMFIIDLMSLEWEVLRWRRLKWRLIRRRALWALESFLAKQLDYDECSEVFADILSEILQDDVSEDEADSMRKLAGDCARNDPVADDKVNKILAGMELSLDSVVDKAREARAEELVQEYVRREPEAVKLVHEILTGAAQSMDVFMANALAEKLDDIERIDRLAAIAESRRNASLCEIERRRAILGATLRQNVQKIEDAELKVIETTPAKGKHAA